MTVRNSATWLGLSFVLATLVVWIAGCSSEKQAAEPAAVTVEVEDVVEDDEAKIEASFASLSPEDRELAMAQKVCPVSGDPLGLMATPIKVDVKGHPVFICCPSCKESLLENPDEYLAKLGMSSETGGASP